MLSMAKNRNHANLSDAASLVEKLICSPRESILGTMAWKQGWLTDLKSRPRGRCVPLSQRELRSCGNCEACGRSNHPARFKMVLSGPEYDNL